MKVTEGIYLIPEMGMSNAYLVEDGDKLLVVDTGLPGHAKKIVSYVKSLGKDPCSVETVVLTHPDLDHSGSAAELKQLTGAKVAIHEEDAPRLAGEKPWSEAKGAAGFVISIVGLFIKLQPVSPDISLKEGEKLGPLTVLETPGHTSRSISLYKVGTALFSGDALLTNGKGLFQEPRMVNEELGRESIRRMATLQFEYLLPGHGAPVEGNASEKLKDFVNREL
jgi:glyoxylase-like metal-dependent hydrolase (beta-lactamase superfamily II)